jgi:hypothetical protein
MRVLAVIKTKDELVRLNSFEGFPPLSVQVYQIGQLHTSIGEPVL